MKRRGILSIVLTGALALSLLGAPAAPAGPAKGKTYAQSEPTSYIIPTKHGDLYAEVIHPLDGEKLVKGPVILTMSPYSAIGRNGDADTWVPKGYVRAWVDVVGTGNSGGCYDYGGKREKDTGYEVVQWLAKQKWTTGKVGMIGGSYNGTTATATAVTKPPALKTIVPEAAIVRWYDYAYSGGMRYFLNNEFVRGTQPSTEISDTGAGQGPGAITDEGFDTPLAFDFGFAMPPPLDADDPTWADRVQSTIAPCDELEHTLAGYNFDEPNYDAFWKERDYLKDAKKLHIPVLVAGNWGDWNVKQEESWLLFNALKRSKQRVLYMGTRWDGHGTPSGDYDEFVVDWMDHHLMGKSNGIDKAPEVFSQVADYYNAGDWYKGPVPKTRNAKLYIQNYPLGGASAWPWTVLPSKPQVIPSTQGVPQITWPATGANAETHANHHGRSNHEWFWIESPPLKRDVRMFGAPKIKLYSKADRKWITMTPSIVDLDMNTHQSVAGVHVAKDNGAVVGVTRGFLDSRYRNGLAKSEEIKPNKPFSWTVVAKPQDYVFKKGHVIALNLMSESDEWVMAKPYPGMCENPAAAVTATDSDRCSNIFELWDSNKSQLILPLVNAPKKLMKLFDMDAAHNH